MHESLKNYSAMHPKRFLHLISEIDKAHCSTRDGYVARCKGEGKCCGGISSGRYEQRGELI